MRARRAWEPMCVLCGLWRWERCIVLRGMGIACAGGENALAGRRQSAEIECADVRGSFGKRSENIASRILRDNSKVLNSQESSLLSTRRLPHILTSVTSHRMDAARG